jgi:NAD(P)-dependent dehydrogenase (short-subunit alcohol dehydrogenase family)
MRELENKVAMVVGAGPGVGRACALAFGRAGAQVVVAARRLGPLQQLADEVAASTGAALRAVEADLGDPASCRSLVDAVVADLGGVDVLVNVATAGGGGGPIDGDDFERWRTAFAVNVIGTLEVSRCAARSMASRGGGSIVQIGTLGTHARPPGQAAYTSTKQAMMTASLTLAKELGRDNVRVNVVTPGYITGAPFDALVRAAAERRDESPAAVSARMASTAALRRHVDPEDIAEAALFLSTDRARNITGIELPVTAGQLI